jgi:hypothetical protein
MSSLTVQQIYRLARLFATDDHEPGGRRYYQHAYELVCLSHSETCDPERRVEAEECIAKYIDGNPMMAYALECVYRVLDEVPASVALDPAKPGGGSLATIGDFVSAAYGPLRSESVVAAFEAWCATDSGKWAMWAYDAPRGD